MQGSRNKGIRSLLHLAKKKGEENKRPLLRWINQPYAF